MLLSVDLATNLGLLISDSQTMLSYDDKILGYAIELLTLGLLYDIEFTDAVKVNTVNVCIVAGSLCFLCLKYLAEHFTP